VVNEGLMQLVQATDAQLDIGGPAGGVERAPGRGDRRFGLLDAGVRGLPDEAPVAGLIEGNVLAAVTSRPSISSRRSTRDSGKASVTDAVSCAGIPYP